MSHTDIDSVKEQFEAEYERSEPAIEAEEIPDSCGISSCNVSS
jgi:hypothetical protein